MSRMQKTLSHAAVAVTLALALVVALFALVACGGSDEPAADPNAPQITVSVKIDGTEGEHGVIYDGDVQVPEGSSVYDALVATDVEVSSKKSLGMGTYVAGIDGLFEREIAKTSGWVYSVNGDVSSTSSDQYTVEDGDKVEWLFKVEAVGYMG